MKQLFITTKFIIKYKLAFCFQVFVISEIGRDNSYNQRFYRSAWVMIYGHIFKTYWLPGLLIFEFLYVSCLVEDAFPTLHTHTNFHPL